MQTTTNEIKLKSWIQNGKQEIASRTKFNNILSAAIDKKDINLILEIYHKNLCNWEEDDFLTKEYLELTDIADRICYQE